jgi:hypothetical protein
MNKDSTPQAYGLMAEFLSPNELLQAAEKTFAAGYRVMDAYSPVPIHGLSDAIGKARTRLPYMVFCFGLLGALTGYGLQFWVSVIEYPINIGGRPFHSGPSFIPVTFELTILFSAFSCFLGMILKNGLPTPYHPVFNVPSFARASQDRFFLCIEAEDPKFDLANTQSFLESLNPHEVNQVDP